MRRTTLALLATVLLGSAFAMAGGPKDPSQPLSVKFEGTKKNTVNLTTASGLPLSLRIKSWGEELGIGSRRSSFPPYGVQGFVVFESDCNFWDVDAVIGIPELQCDPDQQVFLANNTFLEFTPDVDHATVPDENGTAACTQAGGGGNPALRAFIGQIGEFFGEPCLDPDACTDLLPYGPVNNAPEELESVCVVTDTGFITTIPCASDADCGTGTTCQTVARPDGLGICPNEDVPGLVVLIDTAAGLVQDDNFDLVTPLTQRNMAGMMTDVGWEMVDQDEQTSLLVHVTAPVGLLSPAAQVDLCVGLEDPNTPDLDCEDPDILKIDGGYRAPTFDNLYAPTVSIRAFAVNGPAPAQLSDEDGDGDVDSKDAEMAGYQVISSEDHIQLDLFQEVFGCALDCAQGLPNVFLYDFDGNGFAVNETSLPGSPTTLTPVPR